MFRFLDSMIDPTKESAETFDLLAQVLTKSELANFERMHNQTQAFERQAMEIISNHSEPANDNNAPNSEK